MIKTTTIRSSAEVPFRDNVERHLAELRAAGATPEELAELEASAKAVEAAEGEEAEIEGLSARVALGPYRTALGTSIAPPTNAARYWARLAVAAVTGGRDPEPGVGQAMALVAGLAALRLWGEGRKDTVMRACTTANALPDLVAEEAAPAEDLNPDRLARDWMALMGLRPKAREPAMLKLEATLARIRAAHPARSTESPSAD